MKDTPDVSESKGFNELLLIVINGDVLKGVTASESVSCCNVMNVSCCK